MRKRTAQALTLALLVGLGAAQGPTRTGSADQHAAAATNKVVPGQKTRPYQVGTASWYGEYFEGRPTASGEPYNMYDLTAAHPTLPLGTYVRVTNLRNRRAVVVRINDRGPVVAGRIIDLSYSAANALGMIGPGTAMVRVDILESPTPIQAIRPSLDYTLQLGSFSQLENARQLRDRIAVSFNDVSITPLKSSDTTYYRVQLGTFSSRADAEARAREVVQAGYSVIILEK